MEIWVNPLFLLQGSFAENEKREDDFQFRQEQSRAFKRVEEGRAR